MRIQEMRSARAYLSRRVLARARPVFGNTALHDLLQPETPKMAASTREVTIAEKVGVTPKPEESDLEKPQWTVISFSGVAAGGMTYSQATRLIDALRDSGVHGLCVITDVAALQID